MKRKDWKQAEATIASVQTHTGPDSEYYYEVVFTFQLDGAYYGGTFTAWKEPSVGDRISVWYDPANPDRNNLVQRVKLLKWAYAFLFLAFGLWFLYSAMHSRTQ